MVLTLHRNFCSVCRSFNGTSKRVEMALSSHTKLRQLKRRRRTNSMLIIVSVVFFLSWAPLNCFNIAMTFSPWLFKVFNSFFFIGDGGLIGNAPGSESVVLAYQVLRPWSWHTRF